MKAVKNVQYEYDIGATPVRHHHASKAYKDTQNYVQLIVNIRPRRTIIYLPFSKPFRLIQRLDQPLVALLKCHPRLLTLLPLKPPLTSPWETPTSNVPTPPDPRRDSSLIMAIVLAGISYQELRRIILDVAQCHCSRSHRCEPDYLASLR